LFQQIQQTLFDFGPHIFYVNDFGQSIGNSYLYVDDQNKESLLYYYGIGKRKFEKKIASELNSVILTGVFGKKLKGTDVINGSIQGGNDSTHIIENQFDPARLLMKGLRNSDPSQSSDPFQSQNYPCSDPLQSSQNLLYYSQNKSSEHEIDSSQKDIELVARGLDSELADENLMADETQIGTIESNLVQPENLMPTKQMLAVHLNGPVNDDRIFPSSGISPNIFRSSLAVHSRKKIQVESRKKKLGPVVFGKDYKGVSGRIEISGRNSGRTTLKTKQGRIMLKSGSNYGGRFLLPKIRIRKFCVSKPNLLAPVGTSASTTVTTSTTTVTTTSTTLTIQKKKKVKIPEHLRYTQKERERYTQKERERYTQKEREEKEERVKKHPDLSTKNPDLSAKNPDLSAKNPDLSTKKPTTKQVALSIYDDLIEFSQFQQKKESFKDSHQPKSRNGTDESRSSSRTDDEFLKWKKDGFFLQKDFQKDGSILLDRNSTMSLLESAEDEEAFLYETLLVNIRKLWNKKNKDSVFFGTEFSKKFDRKFCHWQLVDVRSSGNNFNYGESLFGNVKAHGLHNSVSGIGNFNFPRNFTTGKKGSLSALSMWRRLVGLPPVTSSPHVTSTQSHNINSPLLNNHKSIINITTRNTKTSKSPRELMISTPEGLKFADSSEAVSKPKKIIALVCELSSFLEWIESLKEIEPSDGITIGKDDHFPATNSNDDSSKTSNTITSDKKTKIDNAIDDQIGVTDTTKTTSEDEKTNAIELPKTNLFTSDGHSSITSDGKDTSDATFPECTMSTSQLTPNCESAPSSSSQCKEPAPCPASSSSSQCKDGPAGPPAATAPISKKKTKKPKSGNKKMSMTKKKSEKLKERQKMKEMKKVFEMYAKKAIQIKEFVSKIVTEVNRNILKSNKAQSDKDSKSDTKNTKGTQKIPKNLSVLSGKFTLPTLHRILDLDGVEFKSPSGNDVDKSTDSTASRRPSLSRRPAFSNLLDPELVLPSNDAGKSIRDSTPSSRRLSFPDLSDDFLAPLSVLSDDFLAPLSVLYKDGDIERHKAEIFSNEKTTADNSKFEEEVSRNSEIYNSKLGEDKRFSFSQRKTVSDRVNNAGSPDSRRDSLRGQQKTQEKSTKDSKAALLKKASQAVLDVTALFQNFFPLDGSGQIIADPMDSELSLFSDFLEDSEKEKQKEKQQIFERRIWKKIETVSKSFSVVASSLISQKETSGFSFRSESSSHSLNPRLPLSGVIMYPKIRGLNFGYSVKSGLGTALEKAKASSFKETQREGAKPIDYIASWATHERNFDNFEIFGKDLNNSICQEDSCREECLRRCLDAHPPNSLRAQAQDVKESEKTSETNEKLALAQPQKVLAQPEPSRLQSYYSKPIIFIESSVNFDEERDKREALKKKVRQTAKNILEKFERHSYYQAQGEYSCVFDNQCQPEKVEKEWSNRKITSNQKKNNKNEKSLNGRSIFEKDSHVTEWTDYFRLGQSESQKLNSWDHNIFTTSNLRRKKLNPQEFYASYFPEYLQEFWATKTTESEVLADQIFGASRWVSVNVVVENINKASSYQGLLDSSQGSPSSSQGFSISPQGNFGLVGQEYDDGEYESDATELSSNLTSESESSDSDSSDSENYNTALGRNRNYRKLDTEIKVLSNTKRRQKGIQQTLHTTRRQKELGLLFDGTKISNKKQQKQIRTEFLNRLTTSQRNKVRADYLKKGLELLKFVEDLVTSLPTEITHSKQATATENISQYYSHTSVDDGQNLQYYGRHDLDYRTEWPKYSAVINFEKERLEDIYPTQKVSFSDPFFAQNVFRPSEWLPQNGCPQNGEPKTDGKRKLVSSINSKKDGKRKLVASCSSSSAQCSSSSAQCSSSSAQVKETELRKTAQHQQEKCFVSFLSGIPVSSVPYFDQKSSTSLERHCKTCLPGQKTFGFFPLPSLSQQIVSQQITSLKPRAIYVNGGKENDKKKEEKKHEQVGGNKGLDYLEKVVMTFGGMENF